MSIRKGQFAHTTVMKIKKGGNSMQEREVNMSIGCGVTECKFNRAGDYCTLSKIHVGNTCDCDAEKCTCCDSFERK